MMRSWLRPACLAAALLLTTGASAYAQIVQSFQFGSSIFVPRGLNGRTPGDEIARNFVGEPMPVDPQVTDALFFHISDFRSAHLYGQWNVGFGEHLEAGVDVSWYGRSVPSFYSDVVLPNGNDIPQTMRLRVVPVSGIVRFLPAGRAGSVQPYVGVGVSALHYTYEEFGTFVDPTTEITFPGDFRTRGTTLGGLVLGGVRLPIRGDIYAISIEGRYAFGVGNTGGAANGFVADKIDLGGGTLDVGFLLRF